MKPVIRALVWDMDGVLVDSEEVHFETVRELLNQFNFDYTLEVNKPYLGRRDTDVFTAIHAVHPLSPKIQALVEKRADLYIRRSKERGLTILPGVLPWLRRFEKMKIPQALCSSSILRVIEHTLESLNIVPFFCPIVSGNEIEKGKPNPECYTLAARKLMVPPKECLAIEDSANGVRAAKVAGLYCIAVPPQSVDMKRLSPKDREFYAQADYMVRSLQGAPLLDWFDFRL